MAKFILLLSVICTVMLLSTADALSQCNGQDNLMCYCDPDNSRDVAITICLAGVNYNITLSICDQRPNPNLIKNPCRNDCTRPLDAITWVRKICLPNQLLQTPLEDIYPAIICATNLCNTTALLGPITIPPCDHNPTLPCNTLQPFCHAIALPTCVKLNGNCFETCDIYCRYCVIQRDYCRDASMNCWACNALYCSYTNVPEYACPSSCLQVECSWWQGIFCCQ